MKIDEHVMARIIELFQKAVVEGVDISQDFRDMELVQRDSVTLTLRGSPADKGYDQISEHESWKGVGHSGPVLFK